MCDVPASTLSGRGPGSEGPPAEEQMCREAPAPVGGPFSPCPRLPLTVSFLHAVGPPAALMEGLSAALGGWAGQAACDQALDAQGCDWALAIKTCLEVKYLGVTPYTYIFKRCFICFKTAQGHCGKSNQHGKKLADHSHPPAPNPRGLCTPGARAGGGGVPSCHPHMVLFTSSAQTAGEPYAKTEGHI